MKGQIPQKQLDPDVYRRFYENAEDMLFLLDLSGRFIDVNPKFAQMLGYRHEELIGKNSRNIIHPADLHSLKSFFRSVLNGKRLKGEFRFINRDGSMVWIEITEWPVYEDGEIIRIEGIARNVTERKKLEENLKKRNEMLELLFKILRHDIANNMTSAINFHDLYSEVRDEGLLDNVKRCIERTISLIKEVEKVEKSMDSKIQDLYSLRTVIEKISENYPVDVRIAGNCSVLADEAIYAVFDNLIRNSVTHGKASRIDVKIQEDRNVCIITFSDDGVGIEDEIASKIFDEGFSSSGGKGLGLYIVRKVIEKYGGEIVLDRARKKGTTFIIKLRKQA